MSIRGRIGGGSGGGRGGGGFKGGRSEKEGRVERKDATSTGFVQRLRGVKRVGKDGQSKRCRTVWSPTPHSGQVDD